MKRLFCIFALFLCAGACRAEDPTDGLNFDLSLKTGMVLGGLAQLNTNFEPPELEEFGYGGIPFALVYHRDFLRWFGIQVEAHFLLDFVNGQISRTGLDLGFLFHVLGGARRIYRDYGDAKLMIRDPYNLSVVLRTGFHSVNASTSDGTTQIQGSVFENKVGLQYRFDASPRNAYYFEILLPVYDLPAGVDRLETSLFAFLAGWRFFL